MNSELQQVAEQLSALIRAEVGGLRTEFGTELRNEVARLRSYLDQRLHETKEQFAALLASEVGNLHTHLQDSEARINGKIDGVQARMDRHAGMLRSGQTAILRLNDWAETLDKLMADRDKRIDAVEDRLRKLEGRNGADPTAP